MSPNIPLTRRRHRLVLLGLAVCFITTLALYLQELSSREEYAYAGIPRAADLISTQTLIRIFRNHGFMLGYSEIRHNPLWVTYHLESNRKQRVGKRPRFFHADNRSLTRVGPDDYLNSGYDRGHLAPNYAIARQYGREAQLDTFLMTNITPQKRRLNQKVWQRLEEVEIDYFTRWFGEIWVITGPIFDDQASYLASGVEIPDAFYKIFAVPGNRPRMLGFIIPQEVEGREPLDRFLASIDEIEGLTGLDFFHQLEDSLEEETEASIRTDGWRLEEVTRLPPRY